MMTEMENAVVYCEGAFNTSNGKTAHGLVRFTERYNICSVVDSNYQGSDSGVVLDGRANGIPIVGSLNDALIYSANKGDLVSSFIMGLAPDGGRIPAYSYEPIIAALKSKLNIICGLHDFLTDDKYLVELAAKNSCKLIDIRKSPRRSDLHFFSGKIEKVTCPIIAILGTDSAVGKRTTAWLLVHAFRESGVKVEMIGTGQTAWLQGAKYSIILDSLVNDFVSGEIEHAVFEAWKNESPGLILLEGQGSLLNPAYPGGFELIAAGRPDFIVLQHAPRRKEYDGFPGYPIQDIKLQIEALEIISGKKVIAITINHEGMEKGEITNECKKVSEDTGLPAFDPLEFGAVELMEFVRSKIEK